MTLLRDPKQIESQLELPARHTRPRRVHWIAWALSILVIGLGVIAVALTTADDGASAEAVRRTDFAAPELIPTFAEYATAAELASTVNPVYWHYFRVEIPEALMPTPFGEYATTAALASVVDPGLWHYFRVAAPDSLMPFRAYANTAELAATVDPGLWHYFRVEIPGSLMPFAEYANTAELASTVDPAYWHYFRVAL